MTDPSNKVVSFPEPEAGSAGRLDSWKEIAAYLKRGVRTVQRWEREENLPVHRLQHEKAGTVYAYKHELDAWWTARAEREPEPPPPCENRMAPDASVAVLPFTDMSREKDQEYFCEGIAEEIINALCKVKGLRVASRTSAFQFKGSAAGTCEIARRLGVSTVLEGSVRKSGGQLRITVQLADAADGCHLWSARHDREVRDIFAIQDEIAQNVAESLKVTLTPNEQAALKHPPTTNVQAYDCYLRGRSYFFKFGKQDVEFAVQLFSRAIELDPSYAQAYAGLADCWSYTYLYVERSDVSRRHADAASGKAVELAPDSAQAWASRALSLSLSGRDTEARDAFEAAIRLDPNLFEAHYFYARHCFVQGEAEKAVHFYERAMALRPEDYQSPLLCAQIYDDLGRTQDARAARERGVAVAERHLEMNPDDARAMYMAANGLVALGERTRGRQWAERALRMRPEDSMLLYNVGCIYSMLGLSGEALDCLEKAVRNGLRQKGWFEHDNNLDPLRTHPRFQQVMRSLA
jgi:TolB-like protein/cytochrome c-type biogenesis protein CcmH/NrfG